MPLEVHLVTPEREVWSGEAEMLIAHGVDGEVGILGGHAPLLVQLSIGSIRILLPDDQEMVAVVDGGFLHVGTHDGVTRADILASQSQLRDEIDVAAARLAVERLLGETASAADDAVLKAELRKAQARVTIAG